MLVIEDLNLYNELLDRQLTGNIYQIIGNVNIGESNILGLSESLDAGIDAIFGSDFYKEKNFHYIGYFEENNLLSPIVLDSKLKNIETILNHEKKVITLNFKVMKCYDQQIRDYNHYLDLKQKLQQKHTYAIQDRTFESILTSFKTTLLESTTETQKHCERVATLNKRVATRLLCDMSIIHEAEVLGWLHDVGKIAIEDDILNKPSKLTNQEWIRMEEHPTIGFKILKDLPGFESIALGVLYHHERFDGEGYPKKIKGNDIPLISRINNVSDAFDAMMSKRVYKTAKTLNYALSELLECRGNQFDPVIVDVFLEEVNAGKFDDILETYEGGNSSVGREESKVSTD